MAGIRRCACVYSAEDGGGGQYMLCLESSDVSAVSADLQALGFQSGINPGRMIRVLHTVVRSFATIVRVRDNCYLKSVSSVVKVTGRPVRRSRLLTLLVYMDDTHGGCRYPVNARHDDVTRRCCNDATMQNHNHKLVIAMLSVQKADEAAVAAIDNFFEQVYRYTVRKALDVSLAAAASASVEEHSGTAGLAQLFFSVRCHHASLCATLA